MSENIEDVESPVVGRFYIVPCILNPEARMRRKDNFWPVIGSWHEDAEIVKFEPHHFHYDFRFFSKSELDRYGGPTRSFARVFSRQNRIPIGKEAPAVYRRRMRMNRQMPEFPTSVEGALIKTEVAFVRGLEEKFAGTKLLCKTCPHRGMSLAGLPQDEQGRVVCNGHGLRWNLRTGELAPRLHNA